MGCYFIYFLDELTRNDPPVPLQNIYKPKTMTLDSAVSPISSISVHCHCPANKSSLIAETGAIETKLTCPVTLVITFSCALNVSLDKLLRYTKTLLVELAGLNLHTRLPPDELIM